MASISSGLGAGVAFSPKGSALAYTDGPDLFVIDPVGDTPRKLATIVDWDEKTERSANITANNPHIAGEFDEGLQDILDMIKDDDPNLFDAVGLDDLSMEDFEPGDIGDQPKLDEKDPITCPHCKKEFIPQ